ncbi:hypothetical protein QJ48_28355 [Paenibacillus sp. A3]|uniref:hypothetical protein n=1 Tax=Paenibacillus sp. A3 TaxID=1337054 RepID=UPI0006D56A49|nr:hypothetical protein [Paenibacillus sp. A3]KPV56351.1 hypothetical protein QJ48_28355 [Paenibacillus sp. A3]
MENILILYGFKKTPYSRSFVPVPDIINAEFKDATVINEHYSKDKVIYQIYYLDENYHEFIIRIIIVYPDDSITIMADEANMAVRAYQALYNNLVVGISG